MSALHKDAKSTGSLPFCEREIACAVEQNAKVTPEHVALSSAGDRSDRHCNLSSELDTYPANSRLEGPQKPVGKVNKPLYTPEQRVRRDASKWTLVQAILAPIQFLVFLVSLGLVGHYLVTGQGYEVATISILLKTALLYTIMITGSIWEKVVFDAWLFAEAFFWEDVFSMLVLALQTLYVLALLLGWWTPQQQMFIAVAAYAAYVINAGQFLWKLRVARLEGQNTGAINTPTAPSIRTSLPGLAPHSQWAGQKS
jgi:3-vinyl bacteriochlorophyllide hydratase